MAEIIENGDSANAEDDAILDQFDEATDKEVEDAGDDPAKLKEIIKIRTSSRQKLYNRLKDATKEKKEKKETPAKKESSKKEGEGLDRVDRAILRSEKITSQDEVELVESIMKETGKSVEQVLESRYFQTELKALRDENETKEAIPGNSKRPTQSNRNSVEYWIAKGELPPMDQPKLRQDVVNAKMEKEKSKSQFSSTPIQ